MKVATTILIGTLAAKQAVATWDLFAKPFSVPQLCENICDDDDKNGFDWNDLKDGNDVGDYRGYQFPGFKCSNKFDKRDSLTRRTFQSKCITGKVSKDKISGPKIASNKKQFSIHEMDISVDEDVDVEFHYGMPDGSTCKQHVPCKKGGSKVKNTMCGGAKEVTFQIPKGGKKDKCELNFHNIDFYCNPKPPSTPRPTPTPTPEPTPSPPTGCEPGSEGPGCPPGSPSATPTPPAISTSVPLPSPPSGTPSSPPPSGTPEVPSTPGSPDVPPPSETPNVPPPSENPNVPPPSETPDVPPPSETPGVPPPSETPNVPSPSETPSSPPEGSTPPAPEQPGSTVVSPVPSSVLTPDVPVPTADCPGEVQKCINTANELNNKCKDNTDSDCYCKDPELVKDVMECLDQWLADGIKNDAFSFFIGICAPHIPQNPAIVTECPPSITLGPTPTPAPTGEAPPASENNPITAAPSLPVVTPDPTPPLTTITATQTITIPCECESPELSTYTTTITVPQVHFTTNTAPPPPGQTAGESIGLVPGTPAPVPGNPTATGVAPTGFGTSIILTPTAVVPSPSAFTGAASAYGANTVGAIAGAFLAVLAL